VDYKGVTESEATYIGRRGAEERDACAHGIPHIYYFFVKFRENNTTNQSTKADVQLSLVLRPGLTLDSCFLQQSSRFKLTHPEHLNDFLSVQFFYRTYAK